MRERLYRAVSKICDHPPLRLPGESWPEKSVHELAERPATRDFGHERPGTARCRP